MLLSLFPECSIFFNQLSVTPSKFGGLLAPLVKVCSFHFVFPKEKLQRSTSSFKSRKLNLSLDIIFAISPAWTGRYWFCLYYSTHPSSVHSVWVPTVRDILFSVKKKNGFIRNGGWTPKDPFKWWWGRIKIVSVLSFPLYLMVFSLLKRKSWNNLKREKFNFTNSHSFVVYEWAKGLKEIRKGVLWANYCLYF